MNILTIMAESRREAAKLARSLRAIDTPRLTIKERNACIRSHTYRYLRNRIIRSTENV